MENNKSKQENRTAAENCFLPNDKAYPLCKGNGKSKCQDCNLYENYEEYHSPY